MIRSIMPADTDALLALADSLGLFSSDELNMLRQMVLDALNKQGDLHPFWLIDEDDGFVGLTYCEPERMTDGTWNLQLIAVHPSHQRQGRGAKLLLAVEQILVERGGRLLLVETLGTEEFNYARSFYRKNGYTEEARIREFYAAGADKVVFCKALAARG